MGEKWELFFYIIMGDSATEVRERKKKPAAWVGK